MGISGPGESLEHRIDRYSATAKTVSEFLFLLRGKNAVVDRILRSLHDRDHSDGPILCAAAEQIAGFERPVSPAETADVLKGLASYPQSPAPTAEWIVQVFLRETRARHIVKRAGVFTTVHRDWAKVLLAAGLRSDATRKVTRELVGREFDVASSRAGANVGYVVLAVVGWRSGLAGLLDWASGLDRGQWTTLVRRSMKKESLAWASSRAACTCFSMVKAGRRPSPARFLEANERDLVSCLVAARPEDWYYIHELFYGGQPRGTSVREIDCGRRGERLGQPRCSCLRIHKICTGSIGALPTFGNATLNGVARCANSWTGRRLSRLQANPIRSTSGRLRDMGRT